MQIFLKIRKSLDGRELVRDVHPLDSNVTEPARRRRRSKCGFGRQAERIEGSCWNLERTHHRAPDRNNRDCLRLGPYGSGKPTTWDQGSSHAAQRVGQVSQKHQSPATNYRVNGSLRQVNEIGVDLSKVDVGKIRFARTGGSGGEHGRRLIDGDDAAKRTHPMRHQKRRLADAGRHVQHRITDADLRQLDQAKADRLLGRLEDLRAPAMSLARKIPICLPSDVRGCHLQTAAGRFLPLASAALTRAGVKGTVRNLTPVASKNAFPSAAATGAVAASPAPRIG